MSTFLWIILISVLVLLPFKAAFLYWIFREDIREYVLERRARSAVPACMYCGSRWTRMVDDDRARWEGDELVLVTSYECGDCHLPFWHVERVPAVAARK